MGTMWPRGDWATPCGPFYAPAEQANCSSSKAFRRRSVSLPEGAVAQKQTDGKDTAIVVDVTRDQLRVAPEWKPNEPAIVRRAAN